jgi:putative integral membrane protein (TIGR02587 family)
VATPSPSVSLREYGRGVIGGLLFSLPLLYTMEVWWTSFTATPERLIGALAATFGLLLLYNRFAGLREDASWREVAVDSVEELGLGLVLSAFVLWLIGQIGAGQAPIEVLGKVVLEAMAVAVGVSVGTAQLGGAELRERGMRGDDPAGEDRSLRRQIALAACGAFLVASNVAPTDEVVHIAAEAPPVRLIGLALVSLTLAGLTLYFAGFRAARPRDSRLEVLRGTVGTYAVALVASATLLWFFGRFEGATPAHASALIVVLGLPAALGASAGRLLLIGNPDASSDGRT